MRLPIAKFVGFFPKVSCPRPEWLKGEEIKEICSVSDCIATGPQGWIDEWKHNELGFFDTEEFAMEVAKKDCKTYRLYAYKLYPLRFRDGVAQEFSVPLDLKADLSRYDFLGFDVVSKSESDFFECSPLSCNGACELYQVNQYCLISRYEEAYKACLEIERGNWEPGPYYLFEVYRRRL